MNDNKTNYILGLISGFSVTASSTLIGFISVPIALSYWNTEQFGLWVIINSLIVYLNISNLGLNAASNYIIARNNDLKVKLEIFKRTLKVLLISLIFFSIALYVASVYFFPNWISLLGNIPRNLLDEAKLATLFTVVSFFINAPFSLISFAPFNKFHLDRYYEIAGNLISFFGLIIIILFKGSLSKYVLVLLIIKFCLNLIKSIHFLKDTNYYKFNKSDTIVDLDDIKYLTIIKTSLNYFFAGIASLMVWNVDNFVISNYLDLTNVATYSITFKLFAIIFSILQLVVSPLIFILAKEFGNNNWNVINNYYNRIALLVSFLSGAAWICSILFYKDIITLWVGSKSVSSIEVVFFLGAYTFFLGLSYLNYGIICALDYIKFTPYIILFEGIINVSLSILFVSNFGLIGIALARFFSNFLWISWLYPVLLYRYSSKRIMLNYSLILKFLIIVIIPLAIISVCVSIYIPLTLLRYIVSILIIIIYCFIVLKYTPEVIKILVTEKLNFIFNRSNSD